MLVNYNEVFGGDALEKGGILEFPDFKLRFAEIREPTTGEKQRRDESLQNGIDGGVSMLALFSVFDLLDKSDYILASFELSMLPYAWHEFAVSDKVFQIRNAGLDRKKWLILQLSSFTPIPTSPH